MIDLVMALHCHQPVGNFDHIFKMALEKCYRPIFDLLYAHPSVKAGLHISGPLLEWIEKHQPESIDLLADLVERKQVEPLSGGFFEPLLASIPVGDARGQLLMMNDYINKRFGYRPTGFWLTERVWDPNIPLTLEGTGMTYTIVDDTHLYYAGLNSNEIYGRYMTEKEGHTMSLLATPMVMRYLIPFKPVEDVISHLKTQEEMGRKVALYGDDGEKFGLWPGTYEWVIQKGWLERFFNAIEDNRDWLRTTLPGDFIKSSPAIGRVYLPQASYEEMTEWALPAEQTHALEGIIATLKNDGLWEKWRPFVRGGIWDNFLVKYEESNRMHKKMIYLSKRIGHDEEAREYLWRAQCNCAYWHGVFGGLYLGHLRRAIHENLIKAQMCLIKKSDEDISLIQHDLDKDGYEEILILSREISLGLAPRRGGGIFEICYLPRGMNLSDTLTRRFEAYHHDLDKIRQSENSGSEGISSIHDSAQSSDAGLENLLIYDDYTKLSLLDHFLYAETTLEDYAAKSYHEKGDFHLCEFLVAKSYISSGKARVELFRTNSLGEGSSLLLNKTIEVHDKARITADYGFENQGPEPISVLYGCEFNLNLYSDKDQKRFYFAPESGNRRELSEIGEELNLTRFELINDTDRLTLAFIFSSSVSAWFLPLMTVSKSEEGFEYSYQGSSLLFLFPLNLSPGQQDLFRIQLRFIES
ncbi:DUF1926 domain-containing protein [Deltaproteobacteria bacterium]|nr:DUF1926 domain-containing protein [Deltaproteobacteria bacterium]